ncbi:MAG: pyridoxal phosphate-dependent aminotransferase [Acidimicrobiia bacterium]|nr:pyridoxal phosphate-dependent aminotransferase [Acidimicrobiia bacterium]
MRTYSRRLPAQDAQNAITHAVADFERRGVAYVDLTESNPTRCGLEYPDDLLRPLGAAAGLTYAPEPFGLPEAREAVAAEYSRRGTRIDPANVVLAASSSEAYGWLFKLLCSPGDGVVVPRPSYPLFEHLAGLEGVEPAAYDLEYHGRWEIDVASVERAITPAARALVVVSPNNPTGSYITEAEWARLADVCAANSLAVIADEVFADYPLDALESRAVDLASSDEVLTFTLGGLSKSVGLPQLKLGWILAGGPAGDRARALAALELIADSYLSVSTPVQLAARHLLRHGALIRAQIQDRIRANLGALRTAAAAHPACDVLRVEGGWSAVVRVPAARSEEQLVLDLLRHERVLVHPGYFFDFPREAYVVVSLLPPTPVFAAAAAHLLARAADV